MSGIRILCMVEYYLPGYKAGGPVRSVQSMVERLGDEFEFLILTRDHDLGDPTPYEDLNHEAWVDVGKAKVRYLDDEAASWRSMNQVIRETEHDVLYMNSNFSPGFTIAPLVMRRRGLIERKPTIVAPRGEFAAGALGIRGPKKRAYISVAKLLGLYRDVVWQAGSEQEERDILRIVGRGARVMVAPDFPPLPREAVGAERKPKEPGRLRLLFLSRIAPIKNLCGAIRVLRDVDGQIEFDIYGPAEDTAYWEECLAEIKKLPSNVRVEYRGVATPAEVGKIMAEHDLFFLPSLGESFGHVIAEALTAGCPVLISDRTPWRSLEKEGVGWDLPLEDVDGMRAVLRRCVDMGAEEHAELSGRAMEYGLRRAVAEEDVARVRRMFESVAREGGLD